MRPEPPARAQVAAAPADAGRHGGGGELSAGAHVAAAPADAGRHGGGGELSAGAHVAAAPADAGRHGGGGELSAGAHVAAVVALLALACAFRIAGAWPVVFPGPERVRLLDTDSYFHLRHARLALERFPEIARNDPEIAFPGGQTAEAAGLFDLSLAAIARLSGRGGAALPWIAAWAPIALLVFVCAALLALARRLMGRTASLFVLAAFVTHPGLALPVTTLGFADHHAAEMLLGLLSLIGLLHAIERGSWRAAVLGAAPLAAFLFTWVGAPLVFGVLHAAGLLAILAAGAAGEGARATARGLTRHLIATAALAGVSLALAWTLLMHMSAMRACALATGALLALHAGLPAAFDRLARAGVRGWRAAALLGAALLAPAVAFLASDAGRRFLVLLFMPKSPLVAEHSAWAPVVLLQMLGLPGVLALAAIPLVRARPDPARVIACGVAAMFAGLWAFTHDYGYQAPLYSALLAGLTFERFAPARGAAALAAALVLLAPPFVPGTRVLQPWAPRALADSLCHVDDGWEQALAWLRRVRAGEGDGVVASWDRGNLIAELARHPVVWARYPQAPGGAWFVQVDESGARNAACPRCPPGSTARWIALDGASVAGKFMTWVALAARPIETYLETSEPLAFDGRTYRPATYGMPWRQAISVRLYYLDGQGLAQHRLVYESPDTSRHFFLVRPGNVQRASIREAQVAPDALPPEGRVTALPSGVAHDVSRHATVKLFEQVRGALLVGHARPGSVVALELPLEARSTGRRFAYRRAERTAADGRYSVRVAYATDTARDLTDVAALGPYAMLVDGRVRPLTVSEADVAQGRTIEVDAR